MQTLLAVTRQTGAVELPRGSQDHVRLHVHLKLATQSSAVGAISYQLLPLALKQS